MMNIGPRTCNNIVFKNGKGKNVCFNFYELVIDIIGKALRNKYLINILYTCIIPKGNIEVRFCRCTID